MHSQVQQLQTFFIRKNLVQHWSMWSLYICYYLQFAACTWLRCYYILTWINTNEKRSNNTGIHSRQQELTHKLFFRKWQVHSWQGVTIPVFKQIIRRIMSDDTGLNLIKQFISSYWFELDIDVEDGGDVSWKEKRKFSCIGR